MNFNLKNKFRTGFNLFLVCMLGINSYLVQAHGEQHEKSSSPFFSGLESASAKVVKQFHQALQTGDEKLAKSLLADDVLIYEGGGIERSAAEYASHHLMADIKYMSGLNVKTLEHQVHESDDVAYSTSRSLMTGEYNNKPVKSQTMETILLKKINGGWFISHIHWSN